MSTADDGVVILIPGAGRQISLPDRGAVMTLKAVGTDTQALDHPLATAIGPHGPAEAAGGSCGAPS